MNEKYLRGAVNCGSRVPLCSVLAQARAHALLLPPSSAPLPVCALVPWRACTLARAPFSLVLPHFDMRAPSSLLLPAHNLHLPLLGSAHVHASFILCSCTPAPTLPSIGAVPWLDQAPPMRSRLCCTVINIMKRILF